MAQSVLTALFESTQPRATGERIVNTDMSALQSVRSALCTVFTAQQLVQYHDASDQQFIAIGSLRHRLTQQINITVLKTCVQ